MVVSKTKLDIRDYFFPHYSWVNSIDEAFSRIFDKKRYDEGKSRGFADLCIRTMIECFLVEGM